MSKKSFYCWYLGFTNAYGFQSPNRIYDLLQNIIKYQNEKSPSTNEPLSTPSKVTLRLSDDSLSIVDNKISQQQTGRAGSAKSKDHYGSTKAYSISYDNITCVTRINHPNFADIVACIVRSNLNMDLTTGQNKLVLNMHAFRFDSEETAIKMEQYLNYYRKLYKKKYEKQVAKLKKKKSLYKSENNLVRSNSPSQNEHLFNNNLRNSFLKRTTTTEQQYGSRILDNSSIGDGTRSSSSQNERDQSMASPISPNESFSSPLYQYENQYFAKVPNPQYLTSTENDSSRFMNSFGQADKTKPAKPVQVENLHREFSQKLKERQIFLFPAKDYLEKGETKKKTNNLNTSSSNDVRYCLNESIVGSEAVRMREKNLKSNDSYENNSLSGSDLSSFREQADQVLKILDDAVEGIYLNPKDLNSNVFEYKPMENSSSSFSGSLQNLNEQPRLNKKYSASNESLFKSANGSSFMMNQKSASAASGLNEPGFFNLSNDYGVIKKNPLHMIEEETHQPVVHKNPIQHSFNNVSNHVDNSYIKNSDKPKHKMSFSNNNNNNSNTKYSSAQSVQTPANVGFRNGVLTKLQGYQPQWMSASFKQQQQEQEQSSGNGYKKLAYEQQNQHNEPARHTSSFRVAEQILNDRSNVYMNGNQAKLKYSESARVNNNSTTNNNVKQNEIIKSKTSNSSNNLFNQKMQNINDKLKNLQDGSAAHNEYYNETSQFILKPASSSYKSDSGSSNYKNQILVQDYNGKSSNLAGTYIDVNNFSKKTPYNNNNYNGFYNSNPALSLSNRLNDVYY